MLPEQQQRIMGYFIEEAKDHLNTIEQGLLHLQVTIQDGEKANELFRAAHSVKGGAAMLGIESIQRTAHRMEDYFKVLKESPVQVDRALETMFLRIADGLKDLLEQLEGPFGLTPDKAQEIMTDVEPVFGQLETHLESLMSRSDTAEDSSEMAEVASSSAVEALKATFKRDVSALLRQLLETFKQPDNLESRKALQSVCEELAAIGEQFELTEWSDLIETARIAVGELSNDYRKLAPILIKEIKKAQDLVLTGRASEVSVSDAVQALLPEDVLSASLLPVESEADSLQAQETNQSSIDRTATERDELVDLFGESSEAEEMLDTSLETDADDFEGLFDDPTASSALDDLPDSAVVEEAEDDNLEPVSRLSVDLEFDEIPSELSALNRNTKSEEKADESLDALLATVNVTGPDVGSEELNSLANLFDGDLDELDNTLGNHTFISEEMRLNPENIESEAEEDLTDLLEESTFAEADESTADESELEEDLFGGTLTNEEFVALDDSFINNEDLEALSISSGASEETAFEDSKDALGENVSGEDTAENFGGLDFEDIWTEDSQFEDLNPSVESDVAGEPVAAIETLQKPDSQDNFDSDLAALAEDVWAEDDLVEEKVELENPPPLATHTDIESSSAGPATDDITNLSSEGSHRNLETDLLDIDTGLDANADNFLEAENLLETEFDTASVSSSSEQVYIDNVSLSEQSATPSLTEQLIEKQSVSPRELDIEFPTLTGEKLQEAEEDIDSFFVGESDVETPDTSSENLFDAESWDDISSDLSTTTEETLDEPLSLDFEELSFDDSEVALSTELTDDLELENQSDSNASETDLEAVFTESEEETFDATSTFEEASAELDELLEDSAETINTISFDGASSDIQADELWEELETDSVKTQNRQAQSEAEETPKDSLSIEELADSVAAVDGSEEAYADLADDHQQPEIDGDAHPLSEADLLDFDTAFGLGAAEQNDASVGRTTEEQEFEAASDEQDLPTFSGDLDEFAEAADGETTISDIADLRIDDAELDSLLGLDFAVESDERKRADERRREESGEESDESGERINESIDSSVIDAFSEADDLFGESFSSKERNFALEEAQDVSRSSSDELDFFDSVGEESAIETTMTDFDELDSLLSESPDGLTEADNLSSAAPASASLKAQTTISSTETLDEDFDDLERLLEDGEADGGEKPNRRITARTPRRSTGIREQNMRVSVKHLDNLSNLVGELVVSRNTLERDQERLRQFLDNLLFQVQQLNDVGQRLRDLYERSLLESSLMSSKRTTSTSSTAESSETDHATGATFDALEMDRFTGFHSLSQEMIELIVRVRESSSDIGYTVESSDQVTRQFRQITTQLQEGLNTARMVAFSQAADRLPRAVRDISLKCGKEARLVVEGEDTLIDKMIVEHLYDPLTHLVNNAITHGIETPEARAAAGKPSEGTITVRAFYQGNQTVIYVADDGGGINTQFVQRKAIEKGLISQAEAEGLSDIETYDLLFHPGFSTRDKADDFAGRGVGMDVVRTSLAEIRGSITIDSELGRGTSFTIRLPLTLSISKALSCVSNQARIAFPMDGVEDMLDVPRDRIVQNDSDRDCVRWRDTLLPFQPVTDLLKFNRKLGRSRVYGSSQEDDVLSVIVLRSANTYIAVQVDQVIGEEEIVIKQLEGPVPKPLGIAGATVLGDGRVMPIADVLELIDIATGRVRRESSSMIWTQEDVAEVEEAPAKSEPTVLIVDDSITVRELLSMSFNKVGYRVEQARDGQEAWDKLRSGLPCDLVFCDIEMPRMDGLELLSQMQKDSHLKRIPIAMLTSRGADRHRQMAINLGASGYFTKPYLEEALLDAAQRMLNGETLEKGRGG